MSAIIILGVLLIIGAGIKAYTYKKLKEFDGVGNMHNRIAECDEIHLEMTR